MSLKILLVSTENLWMQALRQNLESFNKKTEVTTIAFEDVSLKDISRSLNSMRPDVILMALGLLGNNLSLSRSLRASGCQTPIVIISPSYALPQLKELTESGIQGIVSS